MIDENKLKEQLFALVEQTGDERLHIDAVVYLIDDAPTVDAVPVQRCDGCRYADWHSNGCIAYCTKHGTDGHVADGFCSEGEKDGDHHDSN